MIDDLVKEGLIEQRMRFDEYGFIEGTIRLQSHGDKQTY